MKNLLEKSHVLIEECKGSRELFVVFSGFGTVALYEFYNTLKGVKANKIFIRDPWNIWFQSGFSDDVNSFFKLCNFVTKKAKDMMIEKISCVGSSAGGFAALGVGAKVGADEIHAFSPQTFFDKVTIKKYNETRWQENIKNAYRARYYDDRFFNLKNVLPSKIGGRCIIYVCKNLSKDLCHVDNLKGIDGIGLREVNCNIHNVARFLKENNKLVGVLGI